MAVLWGQRPLLPREGAFIYPTCPTIIPNAFFRLCHTLFRAMAHTVRSGHAQEQAQQRLGCVVGRRQGGYAYGAAVWIKSQQGSFVDSSTPPVHWVGPRMSQSPPGTVKVALLQAVAEEPGCGLWQNSCQKCSATAS
jgi:hypothetical protein